MYVAAVYFALASMAVAGSVSIHQVKMLTQFLQDRDAITEVGKGGFDAMSGTIDEGRCT